MSDATQAQFDDHLTVLPFRFGTDWRFIVNGETSTGFPTRYLAEHAYDEAIRAGHDELHLRMFAPRWKFNAVNWQFKLEIERLERVPGMRLVRVSKSATNADGVTTFEAWLRRVEA